MNIIKINAIDSTNLYLKKLVSKSRLQNYTVIVTPNQTDGRGQMGTSWVSGEGKNLTFSLLVNIDSFEINKQFYLSMAVALGIFDVLKTDCKTTFHIKWPNDILAVKDKVAGVLIENIIGGSHIKHSIVGIGLNVNQEIFPKELINVSSLKLNCGKNYDLDLLLTKIVESIKYFVEFIKNKDFTKLKSLYLSYLYKLNKPAMFEDNLGNVFLGKIIDVTQSGRLVVELPDEKIRKFNLKEIKFANR